MPKALNNLAHRPIIDGWIITSYISVNIYRNGIYVEHCFDIDLWFGDSVSIGHGGPKNSECLARLLMKFNW